MYKYIEILTLVSLGFKHETAVSPDAVSFPA